MKKNIKTKIVENIEMLKYIKFTIEKKTFPDKTKVFKHNTMKY